MLLRMGQHKSICARLCWKFFRSWWSTSCSGKILMIIKSTCRTELRVLMARCALKPGTTVLATQLRRLSSKHLILSKLGCPTPFGRLFIRSLGRAWRSLRWKNNPITIAISSAESSHNTFTNVSLVPRQALWAVEATSSLFFCKHPTYSLKM